MQGRVAGIRILAVAPLLLAAWSHAAFAQCPTFDVGTSVGAVASLEITEASGLVASRSRPGVLWTHNDSGDTARVFAVGMDGADLGTFELAGVTAVDWEDIAIGPGPEPGTDYLYLADIGDNAETAPFVVVYRIPEPEPPGDGSTATLMGAVALEMEYADGPHDAETLLSDPGTGDLFIVTKDITAGLSQVFRAPFPHSESTRTTLQEVASVQWSGGNFFQFAATAGDIAADAIVVRTYGNAQLWPIAPGASVAEAFAEPPCAASLPFEIQGESLALAPDGRSYFTVSEGLQQTISRISIVGEDQLVLGSKLLVKDPKPGSDPTRRKVLATARERRSSEALVGDPTLAGATLEVIANGTNGTRQTLSLLPGLSGKGKPFWRSAASGFTYSDPQAEQGPVKKLTLRRSAGGTFSIKALLLGRIAPLDVTPPAPGTNGYLLLTIAGGDRYCVQYGLDAVHKNVEDRLWKARKPTAEGCPPL